MNGFERAEHEMREAVDRYFRVRDNGGDLRPEYPLLRDALREWSRWYPKEVFIVDAYRRLAMSSDGEPIVFESPVEASKGSYSHRATGQCFPRAKRREVKGATS